jgi:hypothetical protein
MNFSTLLFLFTFAFSAAQSQTQDPEAIWSTVRSTTLSTIQPWLNVIQITPSKNLTWSSCYDSFQCTRFEAPLDWTHPSNSTVAVAVIRLPSTLSPSDKRYRGPILFNPGLCSQQTMLPIRLTRCFTGGPGVSGVETILGLAPAFQKVIGEEYDIVSFDPR